MRSTKEVNEVKGLIQEQAHAAWTGLGRQGTIAAGTGFGKSRLAVMEVQRLFDAGELTDVDVLCVSPTQKLRDDNWPKEFEDWGAKHIFDKHVEAICFASLAKYQNKKRWKLVILDEIHRLTELSAAAFKSTGHDTFTEFMADILADAVMGLTATVPDPKRDPDKARIIAQIAPVVFTYTLDEGVADGIIPDYEIRVIETNLDDTKKVIKAGTKIKSFMTTEYKHYDFLEKKIRKQRMLANQASGAQAARFEKLAMFATMARNRFLYNLPSKTELAARCLRQITEGKRTLVFCGSIAQCEELLGDQVYHSKSGSDAYNRFNRKEISVLGVVNAANEGLNIVDLDQALVIQVDSNQRNLVQRVGRTLRLREGHKAIVYILCVQGTADERWLNKSLEGFDKSKITYYSAKSVPVG